MGGATLSFGLMVGVKRPYEASPRKRRWMDDLVYRIRLVKQSISCPDQEPGFVGQKHGARAGSGSKLHERATL